MRCGLVAHRDRPLRSVVHHVYSQLLGIVIDACHLRGLAVEDVLGRRLRLRVGLRHHGRRNGGQRGGVGQSIELGLSLRGQRVVNTHTGQIQHRQRGDGEHGECVRTAVAQKALSIFLKNLP